MVIMNEWKQLLTNIYIIQNTFIYKYIYTAIIIIETYRDEHVTGTLQIGGSGGITVGEASQLQEVGAQFIITQFGGRKQVYW